MSESQITKRKPDPAVQVSTMDNHRMLSVPERQPDRQNLRAPRPGSLGTPLAPTPPGVVIGSGVTVTAQVSKGATVRPPARPASTTPPPTPPAARQAARQASRQPPQQPQAEPERYTIPAESRAQVRLIARLVGDFAAHAGGDDLATAQRILAELAPMIAEIDAETTPAETPKAK